MYMETKEKKWCVYIHINKFNNKSYIGITSNEPKNRWGVAGEGYKRNPAMWGAIQKYGWDGFEHIIWAEKLIKEEAREWEIRLIALFKTNCSRYHSPLYGYNLTDGGEGMCGYTLSEETKEKLRSAHLGRKASDETKKKLSQIHKGKKFTEESKRKISESKKGKNNPNYGKKLSEDVLEKLSKALSGENNPMYGKTHTDEAKRKMSEASKKRWIEGKCDTEKNRQRLANQKRGKNPNARKIIQLSINKVFIKNWDCIMDAAEYVGVSDSSIRGCCNGRQKTSAGFQWMYLEDYERMLSENAENGSV